MRENIVKGAVLMPGFITHYICAQAVLNGVSAPAAEALKKFENIYNLGAQGPDIFFYYLPGLLRKRTRSIGVRMHQENPGAFILNMAEAIRKAENKDREILLAYTCGYLTHYSLDASAHPYVYARSEFTKDEDSGKRREMRKRVKHRKLETSIDVLMLKLTSGSKPSDHKLWQLINADAWQMLSAAGAVSRALNSIYKCKTETSDVYKAMRYMVNLTRLLQSRKGRRKRLMELAEDLTLGARVVSSIIHPQHGDGGNDFMNMNKTSWHAPWESENSNSSFIELYTDAVSGAINMADGLCAFARGKITLAQLRKLVGNRSLKTGLQWEQSS